MDHRVAKLPVVRVLMIVVAILVSTPVSVRADTDVGRPASDGQRIAIDLAQRRDVAEAYRALDQRSRSVVRSEAVRLLDELIGSANEHVAVPESLTAGERALLTVAYATVTIAPGGTRNRNTLTAQDTPSFDSSWGQQKWRSRLRGKRLTCWGLTAKWDLKSFSLVKIAEIWQRTYVCSRKGKVRRVRVPAGHRGYDVKVPLLTLEDQGRATYNARWEGRGVYKVEATAGYGPFAAHQTHCLQLRLHRRPARYTHSASCQLV